MANQVSFGSIPTDPSIKLQDATIEQNQSYSATAEASKGIKADSFEKKDSTGKKIVKTVGIIAVITAAAATILGVLSHNEKLLVKTVKEGETLTSLDKFKNKLAEIGAAIDKKAKEIFDSIKSKAEDLKKTKPESDSPATTLEKVEEGTTPPAVPAAPEPTAS